MNDRPIQKGDLVVVVRGTCSCGYGKRIGLIYDVLEVRNSRHICGGCGRKTMQTVACTGMLTGNPPLDLAIPLQGLKRIPPLSESEGIETKEELTA